MNSQASDLDARAHDVRLYVFRETAATGQVPQPPQISRALQRSEADVRSALHVLATGKVLILAPNDGNIWAANPFCAVRQASASVPLKSGIGPSVSGTLWALPPRWGRML